MTTPDHAGVLSRAEMSRLIAERLERDQAALRQQWQSARPFRYFVVDDLLPAATARAIGDAYPSPASLQLRSSLRERKRVGVKVDQYAPIVGDALFCFHAQPIVEAVAAITGIQKMSSDPSLYASGISVMGKDDFLNPHLDNSHDGDRKRYRVLNLLYYVAPDWSLGNGGNLELWDRDVRQATTVEAKFNRLAVMETHQLSWHSVNKVRVDRSRRCVSNYYFSEQSPTGIPYQNVTTFTGRPEEPLKRLVLKVSDGLLLNFLGRHMPWLTQLTSHRIKQPPAQQR